MLMLIFTVSGTRYAMPCEHVVEVIPRVDLSPIAHTPKYVSGLLNFRGVPVPVVDLCQIIDDKECNDRLHTRIVVLKITDDDTEIIFGIIAEEVTETAYYEIDEFIDSGVRAMDLPFLGGMMTRNTETWQLLLIDELVELIKPVVFAKVNKEDEQ